MIYNKSSNSIGRALVSIFGETASMLDGNNILWKIVGNEWVGKRSVWTYDRRACWLDETEKENVKSWWCGGEGADYDEVFKST